MHSLFITSNNSNTTTASGSTACSSSILKGNVLTMNEDALRHQVVEQKLLLRKKDEEIASLKRTVRKLNHHIQNELKFIKMAALSRKQMNASRFDEEHHHYRSNHKKDQDQLHQSYSEPPKLCADLSFANESTQPTTESSSSSSDERQNNLAIEPHESYRRQHPYKNNNNASTSVIDQRALPMLENSIPDISFEAPELKPASSSFYASAPLPSFITTGNASFNFQTRKETSRPNTPPLLMPPLQSRPTAFSESMNFINTFPSRTALSGPAASSTTKSLEPPVGPAESKTDTLAGSTRAPTTFSNTSNNNNNKGKRRTIKSAKSLDVPFVIDVPLRRASSGRSMSHLMIAASTENNTEQQSTTSSTASSGRLPTSLLRQQQQQHGGSSHRMRHDDDDASTAKPTASKIEKSSKSTSSSSFHDSSSHHNRNNKNNSRYKSSNSNYAEDEEVTDPYGDVGIYTGSLVDSLPHGKGKMIYQDKEYEGDWYLGRWHGRGTLKNKNGDVYSGDFEFDERHGYGKYEWASGRVYEGQFDRDKRHGQGVLRFPDGSIYRGLFHQGQRQGQGRCEFAQGGYYQGQFKANLFSGQGTCVWPDGRKYVGEFQEGACHGYGVEYDPNGLVRHDGEWENDEPKLREEFDCEEEDILSR